MGWAISVVSISKRLVGFFVLVAVLALYPALIASAHQSPGSCNSNRFNISIIKDRTEVYQGQTLTYTVTASNLDFASDITCDITQATINVTLPAADGTPTGQVVNLATNQDFPSGSTVTLIGTASYVVNVNPGVTDIVAEASANGVLHDAPVDHSALIIKTLGTTVIPAPSTPEDGGGAGGPGNPSGSRASASSPRFPNTGSREN